MLIPIFVGCVCHLMHLAARKAAKCLPVDVESPLIDIFYYLDKSSKRKQALIEVQKRLELPVQKIIKHVPTRWLSLGKCLQRLVDQYDALVTYFKEEVAREEKQKKGKKRKSSKEPEPTTSKKKPRTDKQGSTNVASKPLEQKDFNFSDVVFKTPLMRQDCERKESNGSNACQGSENASKQTERSSVGNVKKSMKQLKVMSDSEKSKTKGKGVPRKVSKAVGHEKAMSVETSMQESKAMKIKNDLVRKNTMLYWLFLLRVIPIFETGNAFLQRDEPCIGTLHKVLVNQFSEIVIRFIKPNCITEHKSIYSIDFSKRENQKKDEDLFIGKAARDYMKEHVKELDISNFYKCVRNFYTAACNYMIDMFPFGEEVLVNAEMLNIEQRGSVEFKQVEYFCDRFPCIQVDREKLEDEFLHFQVDTLPKHVIEAERVDIAWHLLSNVLDPVTGGKKYENLCKVAKCILVIYHSNTDCERLFSIVNKNKTEFRANLSTETLSNMLTRKMMLLSKGTPCYATNHDVKLLKKCKSWARE